MFDSPDSRSMREQICCDKFRKFLLILILSFCLGFSSQAEAQLIHSRNETIESTGDFILVALPSAAALTTVILKDKKGTWQFTKGFVTNLAITAALKYGINKRRPFNEGRQAFPSGHTSITFQAASFIHRRYGFGYSIPAYALAGFTAYSRINATRHDGYDVLGGIVAGVGSSFLFTTPYQKEHMQLIFSSVDDAYMLGFLYRF